MNKKDEIKERAYHRLDDLYLNDNAYERIVTMRKLLETAYRWANGQNQEYETCKEADGDGLYVAMTTYYANHVGRYKYNAHEVRKKLNTYIHDLSLKIYEISTQEIVDLLNKVRKIMDALFGCNTKPINGIFQMSLSDTNKEQDKAVASEARVSLVVAGPGTGKTHLIVDRLVHELRLAGDKKIFGLAFTNAAAKTLLSRFDYKVFGTTDFVLSPKLEIGTMHSFALNMLRTYYEATEKVFNYDVIDEFEKAKIYKMFHNSKEAIDAYIAEHELLTFDMITDMCLSNLTSDNEFAKFIADQTFEIVIDEAQDLSKKDCCILKKIYDASPSLRIFAVGDQRQNIYGFRNGSMKNFEEMKFNEEKFYLSRSYRCPDALLRFVNTLTFTDCENHPLHNPQNPGETQCCYRLFDETAEVKAIVQRIAELAKDHQSAYSDHAILLSSSYQFDAYAQALNDAQIPFKTFGGNPVLKPEIQAFLYFMGAIEEKKYSLQQFFLLQPFEAFPNGIVPKETFQENLARIKEVERAQELVALIEHYINKKKAILEPQSQDTPDSSNLYICDLMNDYIHTMDLGPSSARIIRSFVTKVVDLRIASYVELKTKLTPYQEDFYEFYNRPSINSSHIKEDANDFVTISTIHSAKGKEWGYVYVPGMTQDKFPSYQSVKYRQTNDETKKFFVACTRAKKSLWLSSPINYTVKYASGSFDKLNQLPSIYVKNLRLINL